MYSKSDLICNAWIQIDADWFVSRSSIRRDLERGEKKRSSAFSAAMGRSVTTVSSQSLESLASMTAIYSKPATVCTHFSIFIRRFRSSLSSLQPMVRISWNKRPPAEAIVVENSSPGITLQYEENCRRLRDASRLNQCKTFRKHIAFKWSTLTRLQFLFHWEQ